MRGQTVEAGQLCKRRLHNCLFRPSTHVFEVPGGGETFHVRKAVPQVCCKPDNHLRTPPLRLLPRQNLLAKSQVEKNQFLVHGNNFCIKINNFVNV